MINELIDTFLGTLDIFILCILFFSVLSVFFIWRFKFTLVTKFALSVTFFGSFCAFASSFSTYARIKFPEYFSLVVFLAMIVAAIVVGLIALFIYKEVLKPMNQLTEISKAISEGDLTKDIFKWKRNDEIGILVNSFDLLEQEFKKMISEIVSLSISVSTSSQELASSSEEINATSEEIASISQIISKESSDQMSKIEKFLSVLKDIESDFRVKLANVDKSSILIENLSNQVNMLALNASIEAARAGEYGRGFSVVAENIRNLSDNTKSSLVDINSAISIMNTDFNKSFDNLRALISSLLSIAKENSNGAEQSSAATEEQSATIQEMSAMAQELANIALKLEKSTSVFIVSQ